MFFRYSSSVLYINPLQVLNLAAIKLLGHQGLSEGRLVHAHHNHQAWSGQSCVEETFSSTQNAENATRPANIELAARRKRQDTFRVNENRLASLQNLLDNRSCGFQKDGTGAFNFLTNESESRAAASSETCSRVRTGEEHCERVRRPTWNARSRSQRQKGTGLLGTYLQSNEVATVTSPYDAK